MSNFVYIDVSKITGFIIPGTKDLNVVFRNFQSSQSFTAFLPLARQGISGSTITIMLGDATFNTNTANLSIKPQSNQTMDGFQTSGLTYYGFGNRRSFQIVPTGNGWLQFYCDGKQWISNQIDQTGSDPVPAFNPTPTITTIGSDLSGTINLTADDIAGGIIIITDTNTALTYQLPTANQLQTSFGDILPGQVHACLLNTATTANGVTFSPDGSCVLLGTPPGTLGGLPTQNTYTMFFIFNPSGATNHYNIIIQ